MIEVREIIEACLAILIGGFIGFLIGLWQVALESPLPLSALIW